MEHIKVETLSNGFFKLTPDKGYVLVRQGSDMQYSEAVVKTTKGWSAVKE